MCNGGHPDSSVERVLRLSLPPPLFKKIKVKLAQPKMNHFKAYHSVAFSAFAKLNDQGQTFSSKHFSQQISSYKTRSLPAMKALSPLSSSSAFPPPAASGSQWSALHL